MPLTTKDVIGNRRSHAYHVPERYPPQSFEPLGQYIRAARNVPHGFVRDRPGLLPQVSPERLVRPQLIPDRAVFAAEIAGQEVPGRLGSGTDDAWTLAGLSLLQRGADKAWVGVPQDLTGSVPQLLVVPQGDAQSDPARVLPQPKRRPRVRPLGGQFPVAPGDKRARSESRQDGIGDYGPAKLRGATRLAGQPNTAPSSEPSVTAIVVIGMEQAEIQPVALRADSVRPQRTLPQLSVSCPVRPVGRLPS